MNLRNIKNHNFFRTKFSYRFIQGKEALFSWMFWLSTILFLILYTANIIILFLNPYQLSDFKLDKDVFLGFYYLSVCDNNLYLNWIAYLFGILIVILTAINCLLYWFLQFSNLSCMINKKGLIILLLSSVVGLLLIYILNIFNKPLFNIDKLDLINNNWNININKLSWSMQFNYVYDITFISNSIDKYSSFINLSKFSIIWIIMIIIMLLLYLITMFIFFYNSEYKLSILIKKE